MNPFLARNLLELNDCGCCDGTGLSTPAPIINRSGLSTLSYRVGTHDQFKQSLLAQLSSQQVPALRLLTTRDQDDFTIALLDAWATMADVLTFYQERIVQESFLRTATEPLSIRYLARLIGYQLSPGVAASTPLAFTVDDIPDSPTQVRLDTGIKVQSIPGQDEQAQLFETTTPITAQAAWNALQPRLNQPPTVDSVKNSVTVQGIINNIRRGDKLLIIKNPSDRLVKTVIQVEIDQTTQTTRLDFVSDSSAKSLPYNEPGANTDNLPDQFSQLNYDSAKNLILDKVLEQKDLLAFANKHGWSLEELTEHVTQQISELNQSIEVFVFRLSASLFGYNASDRIKYASGGVPDTTSGGFLLFEPWPLETSDGEKELGNQLFLDNSYSGVIVGSYLAIQLPNNTTDGDEENPTYKVSKIKTAINRSRTAYGISGKTTQINLDRDLWNPPKEESENASEEEAETSEPNYDDFSFIRKTTVFAESEKLLLASIPILEPIAGSVITLDGFYLGLQPEQVAILTGERNDLTGVTQSEVITIRKVILHKGYTQLILQIALTYTYRRDTVTINANVAPATHGETVQEILGSGNTSQVHQTFTLRQPPLTYVSSDASPSGSLSTLQVKVNNVQWREVPTLYGQRPNGHVYQTQHNDNGTTTLKFGDGRVGSRLPTGQENIQATYRKGLGLAGNVKANQLTLLMSRPLGLKAVTNPLPASGGDDPESLTMARKNAPLTVLTLDRIVSLQDYEDFARSFAGIAKVLATWTWMGQQRGVFLSVAGLQGAAVGTNLITKLVHQLRKSGDPHVPLQVKSYRNALFQITGSIHVQADYSRSFVLTNVKQTLATAFSFENRDFGQGVTLSEVLAVMQDVPGVTAVDIDALTRDQLNNTPNGPFLPASLPAATPQVGGAKVLAAELLILDIASLDNLGVMS
ncbi:MAG: putative baseplate assembly protein [Cyanobacteria bacterium P01_F01_bin.150]